MSGLTQIVATLLLLAAENNGAETGAAASEKTHTVVVLSDGSEADRDLADRLAAAIQVRWLKCAVEVRAESRAVPDAWQIVVDSGAAGQVEVRITTPAREEWFVTTVPTRRRRPGDLARTLALVVVERLRPGLPAAALESCALREPLAEVDTDLSVDDEGEQTADRRGWSVGLGGAASRLQPQGAWLFGLEGHARVAGELGMASVVAALWSPQVAEGQGYRVRAWSTTLRLGAGVVLRRRSSELQISLGPAVRVVSVSTRGQSFSSGPRTFFDAGASGCLGAGFHMGRLFLGLELGATQYLRHGVFVVDGRTVLRSGSSALTGGLLTSFSF